MGRSGVTRGKREKKEVQLIMVKTGNDMGRSNMLISAQSKKKVGNDKDR